MIDALNWRYATKQFDPEKKISEEQLEVLLEALRLSPSSYGLQPWKFVVVTNPEVREKLRGAAWNQAQVTDASHFVVFAVEKRIDKALVEKYIESVAEARGVAIENLKGFRDMLVNRVESESPKEAKEWATRQVYLALGVLLAITAIKGIDTCPMEGFDAKSFDEILGLNQMNLESRVAVAIGFRSADDVAANFPKVRFPKEEVIVEIK